MIVYIPVCYVCIHVCVMSRVLCVYCVCCVMCIVCLLCVYVYVVLCVLCIYPKKKYCMSWHDLPVF